MSSISLIRNPFRVTGRQVLPGFALSLGISLLFVSLVLLLPLSGLLMQSAGMGWSHYWSVISDPRVVTSYRVTLQMALGASLLNGVIGLLLAWVLVRYTFPGKRLIDALVDLPFALPTAVAGITLATLFAEAGWYGQWLAEMGIKVAYTPIGIMVAMLFTSLPFVVRNVQPVMEDLNAGDEEAALSLGASDWTVFYRVIFPTLWPALVMGIMLSFIRSLGEFGAIIFIAGNMPYISEVTSLMIFIRLQEFDYAAASAIASVILLSSLVLLFAVNVWQTRYLKRLKGN
ncbi:MAG: sulfate/thiosulfate ABC transporter permease CysT [Marinospirillum sp.]|uniref:sulfate/thiosulfate ABC transporter permease CysT n=1 Tax=Marinospirillum sp. TaxID=2183934 RepID=UPI001A072771|nr:sulfate/thiosulfate ABC transporter permease CysT [Marinospirillum sp.]MBE0507092.1 sulfate/thiosulfate ABC transporter permease CysT [Marinospirillum sp.]